MDAAGSLEPHRNVEEVFLDFRARRSALLKAFTTEFEEFYHQCHPETETLCLYGLPTGHWVVDLPVQEVPSDLPEPTLGINFSKDGMPKDDWLSLVALHSDAWLLSVAFYLGARYNFDTLDRERLFNMINGFPTLYEVVTRASKKQAEERSSVTEHSSSRSKSNSEKSKKSITEAKDEDDDEQDNTICAACGENYGSDEFWICCDVCEKWSHGKCVNITPAKAKHIKQFKCPACKKGVRH